MYKYKLSSGEIVTVEDKYIEAFRSSKDFEGAVLLEGPVKTEAVATETAPVTAVNQAVDTGLASENGSSDLPESDLENTRFEIDPVVIKATKSDKFKNTEANAKKLNDRITSITPATSKGQIAFEYLGFEDKGGYITPKLEEKDRPHEYVKINADGKRQVYEYGVPGSFDGYSKQYKNTFKEDLKNKLGESRYNQAMNAVNAATSKGVNLTKDNLGDFVDLSLIPEYVQENVVNSLQATASDGFVQTLEPQERLDITSMLGTDAFKEAVRKENEARLKDEEDYFNQYGRNLVSQQTVMDLKTRKKRTFTPVKNAQLVSSVDSNIAKFKKIAEKSFTNEQKEIKIFGDQLESDLKDYEIKSKKYNELLNGISSSYKAAKKLLESEYSEENVNAVNAIVSEYNNVINSDDFKGIDASFKSITNERLRLTNKIKKVTEDAGKLKLLGIQTNSLSKDYSYANRLALQLEDFFIASPLVAAADIVSYMGPAVVSSSSMIGLGGEVKAMMDSGGRAAMSYKKAVSEKIEKLPQTAKPGDKDFEIGNYLVSTMADQSGSFLVTAGTMVATGGGASLLAAARAATVSKSIFFATEYGGSIYDAKTSRSQAVASIASLKKQLSTTADEGERSYIEDQIQSLEGVATASDYAQTFNAFNAGTIASLAETYGTLGTVKYTRSFAKSIGPDSFKKIFNPAMSRYSSMAVKSVIAGGTSVVGNNMEETLTLLGQNYSKMQVLGDDIAITDGLDTEFFRTNTIVGLAASGPSLSQNITTAIQAEFSSSSDTKKRKKASRELLAIQARLNKLKSEQTDNTPISKEIYRLEKEKNEKIKEISLMHSDVLLDASQMSVDDLDNLVDDNRQLRAILKEAQELGSELDPSDTFNKARIEKLKERYLEVLSSRDRLLNKPAEAIKEKFKKSVNPAEAYYNAGLFNRGVSVVKNIKGINTTEFYGENGRKKLEDFLDKKKVNNKQEYLDGYDAGANAANIQGTKEVLIFNDNVDNALMTVSGTRAKIAAVSPFHEVGHIQSVEAGIVKDGEIVGDADAMVEGIFADIERRKDNGEISEKDYKVFKDRVEQYNTYNNYVEINQKPVVNVDELIQLVGDLTNAGVLKKSSFGKIHEIKTFLNKFYSSKNGDATKFFNLDKTSDIYDFIASWTDKVKQGRLKVSTTEEEELGKGVFSKANKELGNEIKALVPEGTSKSRYDNQVIGNVYEKLVFGTTLDGLINGQLNKYGVVGDNVYGKPKDMFLEDVKAQLYEKSLMRFNPETNDDLGGFVVNELIKYRIGDVVNRYKKEAGVEGKSLDVAAGEVGSVQEVADESMSIEDQIDLDATQARSETRLTKATKIMSKEQYDKAAKMVEEKLKDIDPKKLSYKKIGGLATDVLSEITNVPAGKILDSTKNLSKEETSRGAMFIEKNIDYIRKTLPKGAVQEAATEKLMGTATGVANSILKRLYDKNPRIKKGAGLSPWSIKPGLTNQDILDAIGRPKREDGKKFQINPRSPEGQVIKGILNLVDRNIANELARTVESDLTLEQKQDVAAGKSSTMFSKKVEKYNPSLKNVKNASFGEIKDVNSARLGIQKIMRGLTIEDSIDIFLGTSKRAYAQGRYIDETNDGRTVRFFDETQGRYSTRNFLFLNKKDFVEVLRNVYDNKIEEGEKGSYLIVDGNKILLTTPVQSPKGIVSGDFVTGRSSNTMPSLEKRQEYAYKQQQSMKRVVESLTKLYSNKEINASQLVMILQNFNSSVDALIRTAASPTLFTDPKTIKKIEKKLNKKLEDSDYMYEHTQTASDTLVEISKIITGEKNAYKFNELMSSFKVAIIPKAYSELIDMSKSKGGSGLRSNGRRLKDGKLVLGKGGKITRYYDSALVFNKKGLPPLNLIEKIKYNPKETTKTKLSKSVNLDKEFNDIIENKTGIESYKNYKRVKAQVVGSSKGKFNFFIAPSAEDFVGLLYKTLGKGKIGDAQMAWYKENLLDPYARAMEKVSRDRNFMARSFLAIKKELKIVPKNLKKKIPGEPFTQEQAIRVYIWNKKGSTIPEISENDSIYLTNFVENNEKLKTFADQVIALSGIEDYAKPGESWVTGTITTDMLEALNTTKRKKYLELWQQNVDEIFSEKNLNKLEAAYGADYRKAVENILGRMKTGRNRAFGGDSLNGRFVDWMTGATGAIMFFNTRSAVLQTLSAVNFINFGDNNIFAATKAFANQKQYWSDFKMLFNSEFLVERRDGLKINVNEADIADIAKEKGVRGLINKLLKLGFTPTQLADSFAIATGGATFYRNRLKALIKDGMDPAAAEKQAMRDFRETAEESQQSSRPDKISAQQAGPLGRTILAFANTPAQYARIIKKAASDIKNGRGDFKTNISKIMYYGVAQNLIFNALQQALFAALFDEDEEEIDDKTISIANGMADSILRGIGISGAIISVVKNAAMRWVKEEEKSNPKYENAILELVKISPPVSSKINKLRAAARSYSWDKDEMKEGGLSIDNPANLAIGNVVSAVTNIPLDRVIKKMQHIKTASDSEIETYKRIFLLAGWSKWELGIKEPSKINNKTLLKGIKTRPIKQRSIKTRKITTKN